MQRRHLSSTHRVSITTSFDESRVRRVGQAPRHIKQLPLSQSTSKTSGSSELVTWLEAEKGVLYSRVTVEDASDVNKAEFVSTTTAKPDQVVFEFPSSLTVTSIDAELHPDIQILTKGRSELVQLSLWLMAERRKKEQSLWHFYLKSLPERTLSPILWTKEELEDLCVGSTIVEEASIRLKALRAEWDSLEGSCGQDLPDGFNEATFLDAFTVVMNYSLYLPSVGRFALLPPLLGIRRTGDESGCTLDYNTDSDTVVLSSRRFYNPGDKVCVFDGRPNSELLLATGTLEMDNPSDCLTLEFELVPADRLYSAKRQILEELGLKPNESFQIYMERIPLQLLSFLRLSRVQEANQLAQVNFSEEVIISQLNEYEVLQLVLGECRVRLGRYKDNAEFDMKTLQMDGLTDKQKLAAQLLLGEKRILQSCVDIVRRRLAPIRGVPTKSGKLEDPNKDILDMFNAIESIPNAPKKLFDGFVSWAKGEQDPDWNKKKR